LISLGETLVLGENLQLVGDDGTNNHDQEKEQDGKVQRSEANDSALSQLRLLGRVNWRTNLTGWTEPEKHGRMSSVNVRNQDGWKVDEQQEMDENEIVLWSS